MRPTKTDGVMFVYNFAVVLSGAYAVRQFEIDDQVLFLGVGFLVAVFWTVYFRFTMLDRLRPDEEEDGEEEPVPGEAPNL